MTDLLFDLIVFDLGGVLVHHDGLPFARLWSGNPDLSGEEFWAKWLASPAARAFEAGKIDPELFAHSVIHEFGLQVSREEFLAGFQDWIGAIYDGADDLLAGLRGHGATLATLSNTNAVHWDHVLHDMPFMERFDIHFPSHVTGLVKPDRAVFDYVSESLGMEPGRTLLLDDNAANIEGARAAGWHAELAHGVEGARAALERAGLEIRRTV